MVVTVTVDLSI